MQPPSVAAVRAERRSAAVSAALAKYRRAVSLSSPQKRQRPSTVTWSESAGCEAAVLLVDARLPLASGFTVTSFVREQLPHSFIIMMSGDDDAATTQGAMVAGADAFIRKDELVGDLAGTITNAAAIARERVTM